MPARCKVIPVLVALFLVLTQTLGVFHALDLDEHEEGHPCELCLHLATLEHGLSTQLAFTVAISTTTATAPSIPRPVFLVAIPTHLSRAPPVATDQGTIPIRFNPA